MNGKEESLPRTTVNHMTPGLDGMAADCKPAVTRFDSERRLDGSQTDRQGT